MSVTRKDIAQMASLARLRLDADELDRLTDQLNDILGHFASLRAVDAGDAAPFTGAAEGGSPLREDSPGADTLEHGPDAIAPAWRTGFFTVPRLPAQRPPRDGAQNPAAPGEP
ncbi:hypothetical protein BH23GEM9_BH23GEM9_02940 [soil metagenome]